MYAAIGSFYSHTELLPIKEETDPDLVVLARNWCCAVRFSGPERGS